MRKARWRAYPRATLQALSELGRERELPVARLAALVEALRAHVAQLLWRLMVGRGQSCELHGEARAVHAGGVGARHALPGAWGGKGAMCL
jgi:hypothetical protein